MSSGLVEPGNVHGLKIRGYVLAVNAEMRRDSVLEDGVVKWSGSVAAIFRELKIPQGYHTPIMRMLKDVGSVEQLQSGSRNIPSVYVLLRDAATIPEELWPSVNSIVKSAPKGLTSTEIGYTLLTQQVKDLEKRLGTLNIAKAFSELQSQVDTLEHRLTDIERQLPNAK